MPGSEATPRWDLSPIFPDFDSPKYLQAKAECARRSASLLERLAEPVASPTNSLKAWLLAVIDDFNAAKAGHTELSSYAYCRFSTATRDPRALTELNACEELAVSLKEAEVRFNAAVAAHANLIEDLISGDEAIGAYAYVLRLAIQKSARQMSPELEALAADLTRSGGDAWGRLQEAVSSNLAVVWDDATGEKKTVVELRGMAFDPDRAVRKRAFKAELEAWKSVELPLAAALNGVKGWSVTVNGRRGWESTLDYSAFQARVSKAALEALIGTMEESLGVFRRYLRAKARLIGVPRLGFFDLFAPLAARGSKPEVWPWERAVSFVTERFAAFDPDMARFAERAFAERWIDAEPRAGKVGGGYCTDFPVKGVSRILVNFDGSFDNVTTVAHELGHAWHHEVIADLPVLLSDYPMTLAETASIFAETIAFEGALAEARDADKPGLLDQSLQGSTQVIVDILSRFYFERSVFERRPDGELSPEDFCAAMIDAQKATYGDALDENELHPYMWAVKGHYYSPGLAFYNFPYAFGQLFGLGLYVRYLNEGRSFVGSYRDILRDTGRASAVEVTARAGFDIETRDFWRSGVAVIERQVEAFEAMARAAGGAV